MPKRKAKVFYSGTGRRKRAVASVWLFDKKGAFTINGVSADDFFRTEEEKMLWMRPFHVVGVSHPSSRFSATVKAYGGGKSGQAAAISLGFSRALVSYDKEFKQKLRKEDLLTRDPREVESKKYNKHKARKAHQYSKR